MRRVILTALGMAAASSAAFALPAYIDDSSGAEQVVRSLYNAINRHEFARAYGYFVEPPAPNFDAYESGFSDTEQVDVLIGNITGDGAAGSFRYGVPVALRSKHTNGKTEYFSGCYTVLAVSATAQTPPFRPMRIEKTALKPAKENDYVAYALPSCDIGGPIKEAADGQMPDVEAVKAQFVAENRASCPRATDALAGLNEPIVTTLSSLRDKKTKPTLWQFVCEDGAYNFSYVFYFFDGHTDAPYRLSFAEPKMDIAYKDTANAKVKSMAIKGYGSTQTLINASADGKTGVISSFEKWRGIADASTAATWIYDGEQFVLRDYAVDATYDNKINPVDVIKNFKPVIGAKP